MSATDLLARVFTASPFVASVFRREQAWADTYLCSPYASYISGHSLVVAGANWQRRLLTNPPVVTVRDQMGRPPFELG